jgi:DNA-binding YbaB/EbfC family protein
MSEPTDIPEPQDLLASVQQAFDAQAQAATAGGGVVKVTMSGAGDVTAVSLSPEVVDPDDLEMLQDLIVAAFHDAAAKVSVMQREALGALGQIDLGSLGGLLGGAGGPGSLGGPGPQG